MGISVVNPITAQQVSKFYAPVPYEGARCIESHLSARTLCLKRDWLGER